MPFKPLNGGGSITPAGDVSAPSGDDTGILGSLRSLNKRAAKFVFDKYGKQLAGEEEGILSTKPGGNTLVDRPILPSLTKEEPKTWYGKAANYGYENLIRPLTSPVGILGGILDSHPPTEPIGIPRPPAVEAPPVSKPQLALPPAPPEVLKPKPSFIAGERGMVPVLDSPEQAAITANYGGKVPESRTPKGAAFDPLEIAERNRQERLGFGRAEQIPGESFDVGSPEEPPFADRSKKLGFQERSKPGRVDYPYSVVPERLGPRAAQTEIAQKPVVGVREAAQGPIKAKKPKTVTIDSGTPEVKPVEELIQNANYTPPEQPNVRGRNNSGSPRIAEPVRISVEDSGKGTPKSPVVANPRPKNGLSRPIPSTATPEEAVSQWANGLKGSRFRGEVVETKFKDLQDPSLIDKYQGGDRTGRLADVQKYLDDRWEQAQSAGILKEDQKKLNYLRQYWKNPEKVSEAVSAYVGKNPQFAKESKLPSYKIGREAGLEQKFNTLPEILGAYESEFTRALRNKELYDHLKETKQFTGPISDNPSEWQLKGDKSKKYTKYMQNVLREDNSVLKPLADASSAAKNIYLAGGLPGTKYNMHAYNVFRSEAKLVGYGRAAKKLFTDPTGSGAEALLEDMKINRGDDLADLVDYGFRVKPVSDTTESLGVVGKLFDKSQKLFEKPLFDKALPAMSQERTLEVLDQLLKKGMKREDALKGAAQIGNDFYGAVESSPFLRNKSIRSAGTDNAARFLFLAPEWLESRINLAARDYAGLAKTLIGKGTPVDKIYAKSAARGLGLAGAVGGVKLLTGIGTGKSQDALNLPVGPPAADGKTRELSFGTSDEGTRIPVLTALKAYEGDPGALIDLLIKNKISGPLSAGINVMRGQDSFGNPLKGRDKFGRNISGEKAILNYLNEASKPLQYQIIQGMLKYANGDASLEEALSSGAELPLTYSKAPKDVNRYPVGAPRVRAR